MSNIISLPVSTLPSKGYSYKFNSIKIPKMTFSEILEYQSDLENSPDETAEFVTQLRDVILPLENGKDILLFDAIPVIAVRIYSSAAEGLTDYIRVKYECPVHHKKEILDVRLNNFVFNDMDPMLKRIKAVKLSGKSFDFNMPTVEDFLKITDSYRIKVPGRNALKYFYILSMFKGAYDRKTNLEVLQYIKAASGKDIITLNRMYSMLTGAFTGFNATCNNEEESVTVRLDKLSPLTDIFQNILETEGFDDASFSLGKDDQD